MNIKYLQEIKSIFPITENDFKPYKHTNYNENEIYDY